MCVPHVKNSQQNQVLKYKCEVNISYTCYIGNTLLIKLTVRWIKVSEGTLLHIELHYVALGYGNTSSIVVVSDELYLRC